VRTILWERLDQPGHESARVSDHVLEGCAVFAEAGRPCRLDYRIECDPAWRTLVARVTGWVGDESISLDLAADDARRWTLNGAACPAVLGCDDLDLSFSPSTNLLPLRRANLAVGQQVAVRSAWLRLPGCTLEPLEQTYERLNESTYRYVADLAGGPFTATLEVDDVGLVVDYPGLWRRA
jgi:hypothetical protein